MKEKDFENKQVKPFLNSLDKCWFYKTHGGSTFQRSGLPDIVGVVNGQFIGLELKAESGKASALQVRTINIINKAGGYGRVVYPMDWESVREDLRRMNDGL